MEKLSKLDLSSWELSTKKIQTGEDDNNFYMDFILKSPNKNFNEIIRIRTLPEVTLFTGDWGSLVLDYHLNPQKITLTEGNAFSKIEYGLKEAWQEFDGDATAEQLKETIKELDDWYSSQSDIDKYTEILKDLIGYTDDPVDYVYHAFRGDLDWDSEDIPYVTKPKNSFKIYIDAFNEVHKRLNNK